MAGHAAETDVPEFCRGPELSSSRVGGKVLFATNEWFAAANNMLKAEEPEWKEGVFSAQGKWMDGWESMRKRTKGHDWCVVQLGIPGVITGIEVNTAYFTGNYVPAISIQAAKDVIVPRDLQQWQSEAGLIAEEADFELVAELGTESWTEVLPRTALRPGYADTCRHFFKITSTERWTHLRINLHPDGGVARVKVFGTVSADVAALSQSTRDVDLVAVENGGVAVGWSDRHYGHPQNINCPGRGVNMGDGWETARKSDRPAVILEDADGHLMLPGSDNCVFQLGVPGRPSRIEIDTLHFKGNFPESFKVEACCGRMDPSRRSGLSQQECEALGPWFELLPRTKGHPHSRHFHPVDSDKVITHVRLTIFPDGGVSRFRVWGRPDTDQGAQLSSRL